MGANQTQMMAESARQGQAETENRLVMMKAMQGAMGGAGQNPLNEFFRDDKEVMRLDIDPGQTKELICNSCLASPLCFLPCFWPHSIILGIPCSVLAQRNLAEQAAKAHKLILKEQCLVLEVDPYPSVMRSSTVTMMPCSCCTCCVQDTEPIKETIPLAEIKSCGVELCQAQMCGNNVAADTFVVRLKSGIQFPIFAVDAPGRNAKQFAEQLMAAVAAAQAHPIALPAEWNEYKQKISGFGMSGLMGGMTSRQVMMMQRQQGGAAMNIQMHQQGAMFASPGQVNMTRNQVPVPLAVGHAHPVAVPAVPVAAAHPADEDIATKIEKLAALKAQGILSEDEFNAAKKAIIGQH